MARRLPGFDQEFANGSVYFAQMHALRWPGKSTEQCLKDLYDDILSHATFYNTLIITDSHAIQNWWLLRLLEEREVFPGIEDFIKAGILKIAKRKGVSLRELARSQIGKVPTIIDGHRTKLDKRSINFAEKLDNLSKNSHVEFELSFLNYEDRVKKILIDKKIYEKYNISPKTRESLLRRIESLVKEDEYGLLRAAKIYELPEIDPKNFGADSEQIKLLATSSHSLNFPLSSGLRPVISPRAHDYDAAISLLENYLPKPEKGYDRDNSLEIIIHEPVRIDNKGENIRLDYKQILEIRNSSQFENLQNCMEELLDKSSEIEFSIEEQSEAREKTYWAFIEYLSLIERSVNLPIADPRHNPSGWIQASAYKTKTSIWINERKIEDNNTIINLLKQILTFKGVKHAVIYIAKDQEKIHNQHHKIRRLQTRYETLGRASCLMNIRKK